MKTINAPGIRNHLRVALKHSALAVAVAVGLAAGSVQAQTTTTVIDLGAFNSGGTSFGTVALVSKISQGALPAGSILRSVTMNYRLAAGDPYLGDLCLLCADNTGNNGVLMVKGDPNDGGYTASASTTVPWNSGGDYSVGATATQTLTQANGIPPIDLNTCEVWLVTGGWAGTWEGSITLEYDIFVPARILSFGPGGVIDQEADPKTIAWTVPYGTNVTAMAPTFTLSSGTCDKDNGGPTTYDFTNPVVYTVTDGATVNTYTVTVTVTPASSAKDIVTFGPGGVITGTDIAWTVPYGSDVTTLAPTYSVSTFASPDALFPSGTSRNFTLPQTYTITAQDLSTQTYTVTVTVAPDETTLIWDLIVNGTWDNVAYNWRGQTYNTLTAFFNGKNVIFDKTAGGTITITPGMEPLTTTVSAASGTYTFSGGPIATGSLTKSGNGNLTITSDHTYAGGTIINAGQLRMDVLANAALGTGPITLNGGVLFLERITAANDLIVNGGTLLPSNGFGDTWNGTVTLNSDLIVAGDGNSGNTYLNGSISGVGGLTFNGPNAMKPVLAVANSYTGPTSVTACTLKCNHVDALGSGALSISTGAKVNLDYTGTKTIASLTLGGVAKLAAGTYGSVDSGADFKSAYFAGTGTVTVISLTPQAFITAFGTNVVGSTVVIGDPVAGAANIAWFVPYETNLATVAPTFTLSSGATCDQPNDGLTPPTPPLTTPVHYIVKASDYDTSGTTTDYTVTVTVAPYPSPGGVSILPVCWYDAGNGVTADGGTGVVSAWNDISGYEHHGTVAGGTTPILVANQLNGLPAIQFRADYLNTAGSMFTAQQYLVIKSPTMTWTGGGTFLGPNNVRIYDMFNGTWEGSPGNYAGFWTDPAPFAVSRDGTPVAPQWGNNFGYPLHPPEIDAQYFLLKIDVNTTARAGAGEPQTYQIGRSADVGTVDFDVVEIIGFDTILTQADENKVGAYIASKYGLTINLPPTEPIAFGPTGTGTLAFDSAPAACQWSTLGASGGSGDITTDADIDNAMAAITASSINTALPTQAASGQSGTAYWRSDDQKLGTQPTGVSMSLLMATLKNTSGGAVDNMTVNYTMGLALEPGESISGHRVYWSKDGATWTAVSDYLLASPGTLAVSFDLTSLAWANGELLYIVWADDNSSVGTDGDYTIDNVSFTNSVASGYNAWATTNGATGQTPDQDHDNDGVANGIEYFMGQTGSSFTAMPVLDGDNKVTWTKDPAYSGTWQVQTSPDLSTWTDVAGTDNGTSVSYTLLTGADKLFVRLLVTPTP